MPWQRLSHLLSAVLFFVLLSAPGPSWAQPVDDETATNTPAVAKSSTASDAQGAGSSDDPGVYAPTIEGPSGLVRTVTGDVGGQHTFRVGLHTEIFKSSDFLVQNDDHSRFMGTLALSYTPIKFAEFFFNVRSQSNDNERSGSTQGPILALGDMSIGGKGVYQVLPYLTIGGNLGLSFLNSVGGVSFSGESTSVYVGMLTSFDMQPLFDNVYIPLRAHLNFGYNHDNSQNLRSFTRTTFVDDADRRQYLVDTQVQKFGLGVRPRRLQLRVGLDAPLRRFASIGVTPMLEVATDIAVGSEDPDIVPLRQTIIDSGRGGDLEGRVTSWMTLGVRVNPVRGLNVLAAADIGLADPGYYYGPPVVPWNLVLGVSYSYDPKPAVKVVERERVRTITAAAPKKEIGRLRGRVINEKTLEPVEGAVVTFPGKDLTGLSTDPDGSFLTYDLPGGKHAVMVRHPDYLPGKLMANVTIGAVTAVDIKLQPAAPKLGRLNGKVQTVDGNKPLSAAISVMGAETRSLEADAGGQFKAELKPGDYVLQFSAEGYFKKEQRVAIRAGADHTVEISLSIKPKNTLARLTAKAITIQRQVHFGTGNAIILPDSRQLLDAVVDVLTSNPKIQEMEIQGHTDNRGSQAMNDKLSESRAAAVRDYLIKNGIAAERLTSKGYGPARPKVPNLTPQNRAQNRRVEFVILKQ